MDTLANARVCADVSTHDIERARGFYETTLGLTVERLDERGVFYQAGGGTMLNLFERPHTTSDQAVATFLVENIESLMFELRSRGVTFEEYDTPDFKTENGLFSDGKGFKTSWFKDPDGNILSLEQLPRE
ncbi:MAG: VOC family protein [Chloroflexota bacterium]|nr:VOC family protein [Chloroflexota bacterium]